MGLNQSSHTHGTLLINNKPLFEKLVSEAWQHPFSGWDFAFISRRMLENKLAWDYRQIVLGRIKRVKSLLDMGTGGGEFLSSLMPLPELTCATEGYPPNVPIAKARLEPLGVRVFAIQSDEALPFESDSFDLVVNRHDSFLAREVYRILKRGGNFITQQVGGSNNIRLNELLQDRVYFEFSDWTLERAVRQLEDGGLRILDRREDFPETTFLDVGAVVYYLKAIPWQIGDFTVERYYDKLAAIHNTIQETGKLVVKSHRFYIEALKG